MNFLTTWFTKSLSTAPNKDYGRLKTDPQQTSFENNTQFRYFDRLDDISQTSQIVYKITYTKPVNLFERRLSLYSGGREYLVYYDEGVTFTGTLADSGRITPVNQVLGPDVSEMPTTGATIQRAVGSGIFTSTQLPIDGLVTKTDGSNNRATAELDANASKLGYDVGVIWVVMNDISGNDNTSGTYKVEWEEV